MRLRETAIHWLDGTPEHDRARFRHLTNLVASCFDACLEPVQTDFVAKVNTVLRSTPTWPDLTVIPVRNDKEDTVVGVERAIDPAEVLSGTDDEVLAAVLRIHVESLVHLASARGWDPQPFVRAGDCVLASGYEIRASLSDKVNRFQRDIVARAWGVIDRESGRITLAVYDSTGRELKRTETSFPPSWDLLQNGLHKIAWTDRRSVELQPRQRGGIDVGPRLTVETPAES